MKIICFLITICMMCTVFLACSLAADDWRPFPRTTFLSYDNTEQPLPPGVPRIVDTNGKTIFIQSKFTTPAFQKTAFKLIVQEANDVAQELKLSEELPITESNIVEAFVSPFGFSYSHRKVGNISTKNYLYGIEQGNKFSCLVDTHEQEKCQNFQAQGYVWPISQIDTNAAYQLATQWLFAVHMDVAHLNRDCRVNIAVDSAYTQVLSKKFTPIYCVTWIPSDGAGDMASVRLFLPTKTLLDLSIEDSKYILRKPVTFTNLSTLFPGTAIISTNYPVPPSYITVPHEEPAKPVEMPKDWTK